MKKSLFPKVALGLVFLVNPAFSADLDVCGTCTYTTIQSAIGAAGSGDRVRVAQGTYVEHLAVSASLTLSGGWDESFSLQKEDPSVTVVDANNTGRALSIYPDPNSTVHIENFTFENGYTNHGGDWGAGIYVFALGEALNINLHNVVVQDCNSLLAPGGGINLNSLGGSINGEFENVVIRRNYAESFGGGILFVVTDLSSFPGFLQVAIANSLVYSNTADTREGGGILVSAAHKSMAVVPIVNSTITDNVSNDTSKGGGGICAYDDGDADTTTILAVYNTILYGNTAPQGNDLTYEMYGTTSRTDVYYSDIGDVQDNGGTYNTGNNLNVDPVFVDAPSGDYHLDTGSPVRHAGTITVPDPPGLPSTDLDGRARVIGPAPDMGAYEWVNRTPTWMTILLD